MKCHERWTIIYWGNGQLKNNYKGFDERIKGKNKNKLKKIKIKNN